MVTRVIILIVNNKHQGENMGKVKSSNPFTCYMPIKERYVAREGSDKEFLDTIKKIDDEINDGGDTEIHLINDYGIGGIGKTSIENHLILRIEEENKRREKEIKFVCLDYEKKQNEKGEEISNCDFQLIIDIMNLMKSKYGIENFYCTSCCIIKQCSLTGRTPEIKIKNGAKQFLGNKDVKLVLSFAKRVPLIGSIIGFLQEVGGIVLDSDGDSLTRIIEIIRNKAKDIGGETFDCVNDIINLDLDPSDIESKLMDCFVLDLHTILMEEKTPFVFFFDTYENKINYLKEEKSFLAVKEKLLQKMINELPYVLWFISGRERLEITETEGWKNIPRSSNEIRCFTDEEVKLFFEKTKINKKLLPVFIKLSGRIPFFLNALYEIYFSVLNEEGEEASLNEEKYGLNKDEVTARYLNRMDRDTMLILKQLAVIEGGWTEELISTESDIITNFHIHQYLRLIDTSFIQFNDEKKTYYMPEAIRVIILKNTEPEIINEVRKRLSSYFKKTVEKEDDYEGIRNINQSLKYTTDKEKEEFFIEQIQDRIKNLLDIYRLNEAQALLDEFSILYETTSNNSFKSSFLYLQGYLFFLRGNFKKALEKNEECYKLRLSFFGENHTDTLKSLITIASSLSALGNYNEALVKAYECYKLSKEIFGEKHISTLSSLHSIATDLSNLGRHKEALEKDKECYRLRREILGDKHPDTLRSLHSIAVDLSNLGRYEEALQKDEDSYRLKKEVLGDKHPDTLRSLHSIAVDLSNFGRHEEALQKDDECYKLKKDVLGDKHTSTLTSLNNIAIDLSNLGRYEEALQKAIECYRIRQEVLGNEHPDTISSQKMVTYLSLLLKKSKKQDISKHSFLTKLTNLMRKKR